MAWYDEKGRDNDVVVSSRIRFARNVADYPFCSVIDPTSCREIIEKVSGVLVDGFEKIDMDKATAVQSGALVEKHYISREFANKKMPRALLLNEKEQVAVMVCEEDHVRLQCILGGLALDEAYENAVRYEEMLENALNIAFDSRLGYLTQCLTNLGLGMRASVMVFLPALTMTRSMEGLSAQLSKMGLTIRGMYGEGSEPEGCLYQISNSITMGITEEETLKKLNDVVRQICEKERKARDILKSDSFYPLADRICRSYGTLRYARVMSSGEFLKLWADVRLGIAIGITEGLDYETMGRLLIGVLPANLMLTKGGGVISESERDILRAEYIRGALG